jgi:hypothetical protein
VSIHKIFAFKFQIYTLWCSRLVFQTKIPWYLSLICFLYRSNSLCPILKCALLGHLNKLSWPIAFRLICEIVALRGKKNVDRPESYDSNRAKTCVFIAHENVRAFLHLFPHFLTQSAQKNGIKKFSKHLWANLISRKPQKYFKDRWFIIFNFLLTFPTILCKLDTIWNTFGTWGT